MLFSDGNITVISPTTLFGLYKPFAHKFKDGCPYVQIVVYLFKRCPTATSIRFFMIIFAHELKPFSI